MMERFREKTGVMAELKDRLPQWRTTQTRIRRLTGRISERFLENGGESRTCIVQIVSTVFSVIGVVASVQWMWSAVASASNVNVISHDPTKECRTGDEESCPWFMVFTEMKSKFKNLETSFNEQISQRESLERDFMNHSELNHILSEKLKIFFDKLDNISLHCSKAESQAADIYSRIFLDEIILYFLLTLVMYEIFTRVRPHAGDWREMVEVNIRRYLDKSNVMSTEAMSGSSASTQEDALDNGSEVLSNGIVKDDKEKKNGTPTHTAPSTPKHGVLRKEMCIVLFRKECLSIYNSVIETFLSYFTEIKIASAPYYVIEGFSDISKIPHVKLFILVCDSTINYGSGSKDLRLATIKVLKTWGAVPILIIGNDEESKRLTGHTQYNSNMRFVFSNELVQDQASAGRVFSLWREMSPHQMSHLRKLIKPILNEVKTVPQLRFITLTK
ncbi:uncharacterized protein LOC125674261 isoform X2 [Ostrea edulis]|uniref:uncharacterized protein LOC125674261 isoform X2 n=1 Tax=Ostrea edulis TaxID=37623 RepID=UPI0024AF0A1C|nr:uncharacterized protein LOC125674261 isoform X2 [Ostrea edulis]